MRLGDLAKRSVLPGAITHPGTLLWSQLEIARGGVGPRLKFPIQQQRLRVTVLIAGSAGFSQ